MSGIGYCFVSSIVRFAAVADNLQNEHVRQADDLVERFARGIGVHADLIVTVRENDIHKPVGDHDLVISVGRFNRKVHVGLIR